MKAIYDFQKIGIKLKALFVIMILLATFSQVDAQTYTVTTTVDPGTVCIGVSTTVTGNLDNSGFPDGNTILWEWVGCGGTFTKTTISTFSSTTETTSLLIYPLTTGQLVLTIYDVTSSTATPTATSAVLTVTQKPALAAIAPQSACVGGSVTLTAVASGGTAPYTYVWTGTGASTSTSTTATFPAILGANSYGVTAYSAGCASSGTSTSTTVTGVALPTVSIASSPTTGCVGATVNLSTTVTPGIGPYTFAWSGNTAGGTNSTTTAALAAGSNTYTVTVTDAGTGCGTANNTLTVTGVASPTVTIASSPTTACVGATVNLSTTVTPGIGPYTYLWGGAASGTNSTTTAILAAGANTYTVTVADAGTGCGTANNTLTVTAAALPVVTIVSDPVSTACVGSTINLSTTVTPGIGPYTYVWGGAASGTNSTTTTVAGLTNVITVQVTDAGTGCGTATDTESVTGQAQPTASGASHAAVCSSVGTVAVSGMTASNGVINWTHNGAGSITGGTTTTPTYTLAAGDNGNTVTLTMLVTGTSPCTQTVTATYTIPVTGAPTATGTGSTTICSSGSVTVSEISATNGTISWTENGAGLITAGGTTTTPTYTASAGDGGNTVTLTMIVTGSGPCTQTATTTYTINVSAAPTASAGGSQTICSTGTALVSGATATGGAINWTHNGHGSLTNETTVTPTYSATPADANLTHTPVTLTMTVTGSGTGCTTTTVTATYSVYVVLNTDIVTQPSDQLNICQGAPASFSIAVDSATTGIQYRWYEQTTPGGSYIAMYNTGTYTGTTSTTLTIGAVTAAMNNYRYECHVTGCGDMKISTSASLTVKTPPSTVSITPSGSPVCTGALVTVTAGASGGTTPYEYLWSGNTSGTASTATYTATTGSNTSTVVVYSAGCSVYGGTATSTTVTGVTGPTSVSISNGSPTGCTGRTVGLTANVSGGTAPYSYLWSGAPIEGATTAIVSIAAYEGTHTYGLTVTSAGCTSLTATSSTTVTSATNPTSVSITPAASNYCTGSSVTLTANVNGGTAPFNYSWTGAGGTHTGSTTTYTVVEGVNTSDVTVYSEGCATTRSATITNTGVVAPVSVSINASASAVCVGAPVTLTATVSGGTAPYTYAWTGTGASGTASTTTFNAVAGETTYSVTVYSNGCATTRSATVTISGIVAPTSVTITPSASTVCLESSVTLTANITGGTAPYTYAWTGTGASGTLSTTTFAAVNGLTTYGVTVYSNGCASTTRTSTATVTGITPPTSVAISPASQSVCAGSSVTLTATTTGGTSPYTYAWTGTGASGTVSTTTFTAVAGEQAYGVTVYSNGCATTRTSTATVTGQAQPTATAGGSQSICSNGTATVSDATATYGTILWTHNGNGSLTNQTTVAPTYAANTLDANHTVTLTMTVTGISPCSTATVTATYSVIVVGETQIPVEGQPDDQIVCVGGNASYTVAYTPAAPVPTSFQWYEQRISGGSFDLIANGGVYSGTNTTTLTIVGATIGMNGYRYECLIIGCGIPKISTDALLTVNPIPVATATNNGPVCTGSPVTLTAAITTGSGTNTYAWSGPGGFTSTLQSPTINPAVAGVYTLVVNNGTCASTATTTTVVVNERPVVTSISNNGPVCAGSSVTLSSTATGPGTLSYAWTGSGTYSSTAPNPVINPAVAGVYTLIVSNALCASTATSTTVVINALPVATASNSGPVCTGSSVTLNGSATGGGTMSYAWTGPDGYTSAVQNPLINPAVAGTYTLTVNNGCGSLPSATVVVVNVVPVATATNSGPVCTGSSVTLTGGPASGVTYAWTGPGTYSSTTQSPVINPAVAGTYTLTVFNGNCYSTSVATTVVVNTAPVATATNSGPVCYGSAVTLTGGPATGVTWAWTGPGTYSSTTQSPVINPAVAGTYTLTVNNGSCTNSAATTVVVNALPNPSVVGASSVCVGFTTPLTVVGSWNTVTWQSSNSAIATISSSGIVAGVSAGPVNITLTVTDANGCQNSTIHAMTVTAVPTIVLSSVAGTDAQIVNVGQTITPITYTIGAPGTSASASGLPAGVSGTFSGTTYTIIGAPTAAGTYSYTVTTSGGSCSVSKTGSITVNTPSSNTIAGYVKYKNSYLTGVNGVTITLTHSSGTPVYTTTTAYNGITGAAGYYLFTGLPAGTYSVTASRDDGWLGNNATDALIVNLHITGQWTLDGLNHIVADVDNDGAITGLDALMIKARVVYNNFIYPAGNWKFTSAVVTLTTTATADLEALCTGDVNGSDVPGSLKSASYLSAVEAELMTVPVKQSFTYDIKSSVLAELGAMTLFMEYDQSRFSIDKVISSFDGLVSRIADGVLALAWSNSNPLTVKTDGTIISLKMTVKEALTQPVQIFTINDGSEFADPRANRIDDFNLKMSSVITTSSDLVFSMVNYPNPFTNMTEIVYTIPVDGKVKLVLTNMFGQAIRTLVDEKQGAGTYKLKVKADDGYLTPGLYLYSIDVEGETATFNKTNKMLLTR